MTHTIKLLGVQNSGEDLYHLTFQAPEEVLSSFHTPGQYAVLSKGEEKSFYAIASSPQKKELEFLIKKQPGFSGFLCELEIGAEVESSLVQGKGFSIENIQDSSVHLFSMGSGLAPFRSLIQFYIEGKCAPSSLTLWQGSMTQTHLPFANECEEWEKAGVKVTLCFDGAGESSNGNVCEVLEKEAPELKEAWAFWIGSKGFGEGLKKSVLSLGLPEERLKSNY